MVLARLCVDLNGGLPQLGGKLTTSSTIHAKAVVFRRVGHVDSMRHIHIALLRLPAIRLVLAVYCTLFPIFFSQPPSIHHPATTIFVNRASTCFYLRASLTSHCQLAKSLASLIAFPTLFFFLLLTTTFFVRHNNVFSTNSRSKPDIGSRLPKKEKRELEF